MKQHLAIMIRERAKKYGSREMIRYFDKRSSRYTSISWASFVAEADKLAHALSKRGYGNESKIGILSNNSARWLIADLAVMTVRGISVPFYSTTSKEQIKYIVDETSMQVIFAGNQEQLEKAVWLADHCDSLKEVIVMEQGLNIDDSCCTKWDDLLKEPDFDNNKTETLLSEVQPDDILTIIYTSGTTGTPKGAMMCQENFLYAFEIHDERMEVTDSDVSLCFLPLSHVFERTWSLYLMHVGATNVILENPKEVIETLKIVRPSLMCAVPRFFEKTYEGIQKEYYAWPGFQKKIFDWAISTGLKTLAFRRFSKKIPPWLQLRYNIANLLVLKKMRKVFGGNIKTMPCSGAAIRPELLRFFHAAGIFINYGYGATETTATVSCFKTDEYEFYSCGTVMPGVSVKFDENKQILVKGKTVFRGYFQKLLETSEVLTEDGWYKSGDEGYLTEEGNLIMTDRSRDIIKTSVGKYVSPQKIELLLSKDPFIENVAVVGDNRKYISALIVPDFDQLSDYASRSGIIYTDQAALLVHHEIIRFFEKRLEDIQKELTPFERVVKFTLLPEPFSIDNQVLTSTLKIRRKVIEMKYKDLIEKMY